jgi:hypothetical protein
MTITTPPRIGTAQRVLCAALVAGVATLGLGVSTAQAQQPEPATSERIDRACARIPNVQLRLDNAAARITGGPEVRGSLLWLDTKIQAATDAGRTDLATALSNRRAVRVATLDVVRLRQANLAEFAALCDARG